MDLLKKEMERKKLAMAAAKSKVLLEGKNSNATRFVKAGELRRMQEEEEERLQAKRKREQAEEGDDTKINNNNNNMSKSDESRRKAQNEADLDQNKTVTPDHKKSRTSTTNTSTMSVITTSSVDSAAKNIAPADLLKRLRNLGLPIRLFGETLEERIQRYQVALKHHGEKSQTQTEMDEFRLGKGHGIRNPFLETKKSSVLKASQVAAAEKEELSKRNSAPKASAVSTNQNDNLRSHDKNTDKKKSHEHDDEDTTNDPHKRIYRYFKSLLVQWENDLAIRPESVKRTAAGKNETKTLKQCKDYIRPLFKLCKTRNVEESLMNHLVNIVNYCQAGEFVKAHDSYLDVAIGRAAWPIGVTMVGIHARSGRAKIESSKVAHVMNSELQRKYLTSVKRLMSYAQKKADHVDPSKKVMN